ncbi:hypothetical protein PHPALM_28578 [Phytophthora palmivora]|uniref:Integrase catalytic domain-containing protein n=1 Tax=Phytophthora palmivora TaxID=4796 RepID=A0A2P4X9Q7_9STRA|nr:hypothetical protein PHPALM_28578 [Phytophthora palmivora]
MRGGDVGDRWALDIAGPFPITNGGERYVVAAVEYVTRYAVARCVHEHTAKSVVTFLMEDIVLKFGAFRELLTGGAPEMTGRVIEDLVLMLQAKQVNPVPYRPQMIGLVESFHRSWKDCVATFMTDEKQNDWNLWVKFAVYAYNSAKHSTVALSPNELMMGRRLRPPNELLRRPEVTEAGELQTYHEQLIVAVMTRSFQCAEEARQREQSRQARYYNRKLYNPPRGRTATKFVHQWMGPMKIVEPAGYENYILQREDKTGCLETVIAHVSFLVSYYYYRTKLQLILTSSYMMKIKSGTNGMSRQQQRLYEQRRQVKVDEQQQRWQSELMEQLHVKTTYTTRVANWWSCEGGGSGIELDNTCSSTSYSHWATSDDGRQETDDSGQHPPEGQYPDGSLVVENPGDEEVV